MNVGPIVKTAFTPPQCVSPMLLQKKAKKKGKSHISTHINVSCRTFSQAVLPVAEHLPQGQQRNCLSWGSDRTNKIIYMTESDAVS